MNVHVTSTEGATEFRAGYNPSFLKKARERERQKEKAIRKEVEAKVQEELDFLKDRVGALEEENSRLRVTLATVKECGGMEEIIAGAAEDGAKLSVREIIQVVANKHAVTVGEILGPSRNKRIVAARHEAMAEAGRLRPDLSLPQIGRQFGKRDHTTVLHALRKMGVRK